MDEAGWVSVADALALTGLDHAELEEVVRTNTKQRLQLEGERLRACQGHSLEGTPVTLEALEASWSPREGNEPLFHGTFREAIPSIATEGLTPQKRTHVHLTAQLDSPVGKRAGVGLALEIDPRRLRDAGLAIHQAPNGVILVRSVPPAAFVALHPLSKKARAQAAELRAMLGL